jgi:glycosyltransferase involved in cell wall biosynthesis
VIGPADGTEPLRITLVVGSLRIGGTETQVVKLAVDLLRRGHDVDLIAMAGGGPLEEEVRAAGVPLRVLAYHGLWPRKEDRWRSPRTLLRTVRELYACWRHLRARKPDVCHAFNFTCYTITLPIAWAAGVPVRVNGRRGAAPPTPTGLRRRLLDSVSRRSSSVYVCNSRAGAAELVRDERIPVHRVEVIHNRVELPGAVADPARQPARGLVVASLTPHKGHADLIEALALLEAPPSMCFVGDGPERADIAARLRRLGLEGAVELAGAIPGAAGLLPGHQFAVLPSHHEGLPNAVLEAMAAGLPVIATAVGGVPEIVTDGVTGLLVPPHEPRELAAAIARLTGDPRLRVTLGQAARHAAERLGARSCAARHEAVYRTTQR